MSKNSQMPPKDTNETQLHGGTGIHPSGKIGATTEDETKDKDADKDKVDTKPETAAATTAAPAKSTVKAPIDAVQEKIEEKFPDVAGRVAFEEQRARNEAQMAAKRAQESGKVGATGDQGEPYVPTLADWREAGYSEEAYHKRFGENPQPNVPEDKRFSFLPKKSGDVTVRVLKSEQNVSLGDRRYVFVQGQEIQMSESHAQEMAASGWVKIVDESR